MIDLIETARLRLEPLVAAHAVRLFDGLQEPRLYAYLDESPPASLEWLEARYRRLETRRSADGTERWLNWAICAKAPPADIGYVQATVRADGIVGIAYVLFPAYGGAGLATEAVRAMLATVCASAPVQAFEARIDARNARSIALAERLGFVVHGRAGADAQDVRYRRTVRPAA